MGIGSHAVRKNLAAGAEISVTDSFLTVFPSQSKTYNVVG